MALIKKIANSVNELTLFNGELGYVKSENRVYIGLDGVNRPIINIDATQIDPNNLDLILKKFDDLASVVATIKGIAENPVINTIVKEKFVASDDQDTFPFKIEDLQDIDVFVDGVMKDNGDDYQVIDEGIKFNNGLSTGTKVVIRGFYGIKLNGLTSIDIDNLFPGGLLDLNEN